MSRNDDGILGNFLVKKGCLCLPSPQYTCKRDPKKKRNESKLKGDSPHDLFSLKKFFKNLHYLYETILWPLESSYCFPRLISSKLTPQEFTHVPVVLVIGQICSGKSSLICYLLNDEYKSLRIGPEPTTQHFNVIVHGNQNRIIPGNLLASDSTKSFNDFTKFGNSFLEKMQCIECNNLILERVTLIDTPGLIFTTKDSEERKSSYRKALQWFIQKADLIIFMFDCQKISFTFQELELLKILSPNMNKVRMVLNKAEVYNSQQLMRIYGSFMWNLSQLVSSVDTPRVYVGTFGGNFNYENQFFTHLFNSEQTELLNEIKNLPKTALLQKINDFIKRAHLAIINAYIVSYLKNETTFFNEDETKYYLLNNLRNIYTEISKKHGVHLGDFPNAQLMRKSLERFRFSSFNRLKQALINNVKNLIGNQIPEIINQIQTLTLINDSRLTLEGGIFDTFIWKIEFNSYTHPPRYNELEP